MPDETHLPAIVEPTPLLLIQQALDAKISPRDLKDLFDLQERHERNHAEKAYADAITAFQAECPPIRKTSENKGTNKKYADYETIMRTIMPLLRRHRIVISWDTKEAGEQIHIICRVRVGTVEKLTSVAMPTTAASAKMNDQQAAGGAVTYGRRYAIVAALNLYDTDEDTDAQDRHDSHPLNQCVGETPETISVAGQNDLDELLRAAGCQNSNHLRLALNWIAKAQGLPCNSLADVTCAAYPRIVAEFQSRAARRTQAEAAKKANGGAA